MEEGQPFGQSPRRFRINSLPDVIQPIHTDSSKVVFLSFFSRSFHLFLAHIHCGIVCHYLYRSLLLNNFTLIFIIVSAIF